MAPNPPRFESIEIPERPTVSLEPAHAPRATRRLLLWGGVAGAGVVVLALLGIVLSGGSHETAHGPSGAPPLIKADEQPIKVSPENPGGMNVPNRDMMVYGRIQGTPGGKPPVERLLPEPEEPMTPPAVEKAEAPAAEPAAEASSAAVAPSPAPLPETIPPAAPMLREVPPSEPAPRFGSSPVSAEPTRSSIASATSEANGPDSMAATPAVPETAPAEPVVVSATPAPKPAPPAPKPPVMVASAPKSLPIPPKSAEPSSSGSSSATAASGAYLVQLFAGRSPEEANAAWAKLRGKYGDVLGPLAPSYARADLGDRGVFYRLRAGPLDSEAKAKSVCSQLSGRGAPCIIIRPAK